MDDRSKNLVERFTEKNNRLRTLADQGALPKEFYHEVYEEGRVIQHSDGRMYQVDQNGSWRRIKTPRKEEQN